MKTKSYFHRRWLADCNTHLERVQFLRAQRNLPACIRGLATQQAMLFRRYLDNSATTNRPGGL